MQPKGTDTSHHGTAEAREQQAKEPEDLLDSWKEIAALVNRTVRTVMRWADKQGMPVRRVPGATRSRVYASRREILDWLQNRKPEPKPEVPARSKIRLRTALIILGCFVVVLALGASLLFGFMYRPNLQDAKIAGAELTALDASGRSLWRFAFPRTLIGLSENPILHVGRPVRVEDLDGDGRNEVLVAAEYGVEDGNPDELYCFSRSGRVLWRYRPEAEFTFVGRHAKGPWKIHALTTVPDGQKKVVWAAFSDPRFAPTFVASIDAQGRYRVQYVSSGVVYSLTSVANEKGTFILAGGTNNEYRAASFAVLDSRQGPVTSPQTPGNRFACTDCPAGRPHLFVVLPRSEVNVGSGLPYNRVATFYNRDGTVLVDTHELETDGISTTNVVELSADFIPTTITHGADYKEAHERLERRGAIDHAWRDCKEQNEPAVARVWDEAHGWRDVQVLWIR